MYMYLSEMARLMLIDLALREEWLDEQNCKRQCRRREKAARAIPGDSTLLAQYRINASILEQLREDLVPLLPRPLNSKAVDPISKILAALSFYASGHRQQELVKESSLAQQTLSRTIRQVTEAISSPDITKKYIRFPKNQVKRSHIKERFYELSNIPGVCGCIDCIHVGITRSHNSEDGFINNKKYSSINVQMVCDSEFRILDVDAHHGGATDDALIWENCQLKKHIETLASTGEEAIVLGDTAYRLSECMMIPVDGALENSPEDHYNACHKKARSSIERTFELLKGRWRCLMSFRDLNYSPGMAAKIVLACAVLHNMCLKAGLEPVELTEKERQQELQKQPHPTIPDPGPRFVEGNNERERIIRLLNGISSEQQEK